MPLHDWTTPTEWPMVHHMWISELVLDLRAKLPKPYRAHLGPSPLAGLGITPNPDVSVRRTGVPPEETEPAAGILPDDEVAVAVVEDSETVVTVQTGNVMVAVIELMSPRNKDRPEARDDTTGRLASYLRFGVHVMVVDVLPRPRGFSFADAIETALEVAPKEPMPAPFAASYRMSWDVLGVGRLARWRRGLRVGERLPELPLPLTTTLAVPVDLEGTYSRAAVAADLT